MCACATCYEKEAGLHSAQDGGDVPTAGDMAVSVFRRLAVQYLTAVHPPRSVVYQQLSFHRASWENKAEELTGGLSISITCTTLTRLGTIT